MSGVDLEAYLNRPYAIVLYSSPEGGFAVEIPDLPGCLSQGETEVEALAAIEDAKRPWLTVALQDERPIPLPTSAQVTYSGRFVVRLPRSLHRSLVTQARLEGVSLNQYVQYRLAQASPRPQRKRSHAYSGTK